MLNDLVLQEALEVLRTTPQTVKLLVCRPPQNELPVPQSAGEPPPPPRRDPSLAISSSLPLEISPVANLTPEIYGVRSARFYTSSLIPFTFSFCFKFNSRLLIKSHFVKASLFFLFTGV